MFYGDYQWYQWYQWYHYQIFAYSTQKIDWQLANLLGLGYYQKIRRKKYSRQICEEGKNDELAENCCELFLDTLTHTMIWPDETNCTTIKKPVFIKHFPQSKLWRSLNRFYFGFHFGFTWHSGIFATLKAYFHFENIGNLTYEDFNL